MAFRSVRGVNRTFFSVTRDNIRQPVSVLSLFRHKYRDPRPLHFIFVSFSPLHIHSVSTNASRWVFSQYINKTVQELRFVLNIMFHIAEQIEQATQIFEDVTNISNEWRPYLIVHVDIPVAWLSPSPRLKVRPEQRIKAVSISTSDHIQSINRRKTSALLFWELLSRV